MPKKGNPTASDSNLYDKKPPPRPKLFQPNRLKLWDILENVDQPKGR